ncbi:hypothetical protein PVAP13_5NG089643 [Panicum virgatum]|uniref:Uncharacterized protein n=1 Tax=Panicum virgatum TaxID=38727 RepID=A0A8T0RQ78_PANVG|nr:hypothetical protein PVAP13_5NG089643 [Panicum virgatum]
MDVDRYRWMVTHDTRDTKQQATHIHHKDQSMVCCTHNTLLEHRHRCPTGRGGRTRRRRRRRRHLSTIIIIVPHQYHLLAARATPLLSMPHTLSDKRTTHTQRRYTSFRSPPVRPWP